VGEGAALYLAAYRTVIEQSAKRIASRHCRFGFFGVFDSELRWQ